MISTYRVIVLLLLMSVAAFSAGYKTCQLVHTHRQIREAQARRDHQWAEYVKALKGNGIH